MVRIPKEIEQMPLTIEKRHKPAYIQAIEDDELIQDQEEEEEPGILTSSIMSPKVNIHLTLTREQRDL